MRSSVDEVRKRNKSGGEANCRAIECGNENLGVSVKGVGDFEVVGYEVSKGLAAKISSFCHCAGGSDVGSAAGPVSIPIALGAA